MKTMTYRTSTTALDRMWYELNKLRTGSKSVKVSVDDLRNLLMDHSQLAQIVKED